MYIITGTDKGFIGDVIAVTDNREDAQRMLESARMADTRRYTIAYMGGDSMRAVYNKVKADLDAVVAPF